MDWQLKENIKEWFIFSGAIVAIGFILFLLSEFLRYLGGERAVYDFLGFAFILSILGNIVWYSRKKEDERKLVESEEKLAELGKKYKDLLHFGYGFYNVVRKSENKDSYIDYAVNDFEDEFENLLTLIKKKQKSKILAMKVLKEKLRDLGQEKKLWKAKKHQNS